MRFSFMNRWFYNIISFGGLRLPAPRFHDCDYCRKRNALTDRLSGYFAVPSSGALKTASAGFFKADRIFSATSCFHSSLFSQVNTS